MTLETGQIRGETLRERIASALVFNERMRYEMRLGFLRMKFSGDLPVAGHPDDCDLGKWILWELSTGENLDRLQELDRYHCEFHRLSQRVMDATRTWDLHNTAAAWQQYLKSSMDFENQLASWLRELDLVQAS